MIIRDTERVTRVVFPPGFAPRDVDTWDDYEALQAMVQSDKAAVTGKSEKEGMKNDRVA